MGVEDLIEKAKESASAITDKLAEIKENLIGEESKAIMDEFKEAGSSKVKEIVEMLEDSKNYITRAGYELSSANVSLGLPPEVGLSFNYKSEVGEAERTQLIEEVKDRKVLSIILKCLFKAGDFYTAAKFKDYKLGSVNISLGLTPGVNIHFIK
jgi:hypothetical protein